MGKTNDTTNQCRACGRVVSLVYYDNKCIDCHTVDVMAYVDRSLRLTGYFASQGSGGSDLLDGVHHHELPVANGKATLREVQL